MPTVNDSAILKSDKGFVRPSDLVGTTPNLLTVTTLSGNESYAPYKVEETRVSFARIRFSHGVFLDLGYDTVMIGTVKTGYEGAQPKNTLDVVEDIQRKFKYQTYKPSDFDTIGEKEYIIDLSEFTDKKSGTFNLAQPVIYKFLGWSTRVGTINSDGDLVVRHPEGFDRHYTDIIHEVPMELERTYTNSMGTYYVYKRNWFVDVVEGLGACRSDLFVADDISFNCTADLAKSFRDGFIYARRFRPNMKYNEGAIRYDCAFTEDRVSDLMFLLHRAGASTILVNDTKGYRISEQIPKWSHYVQTVEHFDIPEVMYKITPVNNTIHTALWISEVLFLAAK